MIRNQRWQKCKSQRSLFSRFLLSLTTNRVYKIREDFASKYLFGKGYEIGAQKAPLKCKNTTSILYIDYLNKKESSRRYNIPESECIDVDIIADANNLKQIPSESASFIIANHVLEHSPNPISTLYGWIRILQNRGILFLTLPNSQSNEYDFERDPVTGKHLHDDLIRASKGKDIATEHIYEHIQIVDDISRSSNRFSQRFNEIVQSGLHPHYHVFSPNSAIDLINIVHQHFPIKVKSHWSFKSCFELIYIIEKVPSPKKQRSFRLYQDRLFTMYLFIKHTFLYIFSKPCQSILFHLIFRRR